MITTRPANTSDIAALVHLSEILGYPTTSAETHERLQVITASPRDVLIVAVSDDQVIGMVHIFLKQLLLQPSTAEVGGLAVHENFQGQGVGKTLMTAAEVWAREHQAGRMVVKSNVMRQKAHAFYQAIGFTSQKRQVVFQKLLK